MLSTKYAKISPTGAYYIITYKRTKKQLAISSYTTNYLQEVLTKYIFKHDKYKVLIVQHNNRPMTVIKRTYYLDKNNAVTDYIQILAEGDKLLTRDDIENYIKTKQYIELEVV